MKEHETSVKVAVYCFSLSYVVSVGKIKAKNGNLEIRKSMKFDQFWWYVRFGELLNETTLSKCHSETIEI